MVLQGRDHVQGLAGDLQHILEESWVGAEVEVAHLSHISSLHMTKYDRRVMGRGCRNPAAAARGEFTLDVVVVFDSDGNAQQRQPLALVEAALCGQTYVLLLPGSTGGVRTGVEKILIPQLDHRQKPCNFVMLLPRIKNEPTGLGDR